MKISKVKQFTLLKAIGLGVCVILIFLTVAAFSISLILDTDNKKCPSDQDLMTTFEQSEPEFNQLINMSKEDPKLIRIADSFTWSNNNTQELYSDSELSFSKERWDEYKQLFSKLKLEGGLLQYPQNGICYLIAYNRGGPNKGYVFSTKQLSPLFDSLDDLETKEGNGISRYKYKKLKGNWYIYLENDY